MNERVVLTKKGLKALAQPMNYGSYAFHKGFICPLGMETDKGYLVKYSENELLTRESWFNESDFELMLALEAENTEQQIEQEIQSKNLNAPRLTPDHIDSKIKAVEYILPRDVCKRDNGVEVFDAPLPLQTLTFCILTLENGFTVTGESACASPENFDAEIGKKIAYDNAREKIWLLEGYLLKEKLNHQIKIQEHFASQGVDAEKLQDSPIVSELPELEIKYSDAVKSTDPTNDNQACASGSASSNGYQLNAKRDNAFLVAQLLSNNKISAELRKKAETKMTALLDELI
ncbi:MAG: hypothetical protein L0G93_00120 [Acinetobacter sp.]|nr:hypothetical protein [Acinetobacter sp.]